MFKRFRFNKIRTKLLVVVLITTIPVYIIAIGYLSYNLRKISLRDTKKFVDSYAKEYANYIKADLNVEINYTRILADAFIGYQKLGDAEKTLLHKNMLSNAIKRHSKILAIYVHFDRKRIDAEWKKFHGRFRYTFYRHKNNIVYRVDTMDIDSEPKNKSFYKQKMNPQEIIEDPYLCTYTKKKEDEILETTVLSPIIDNGTFIGRVGIDIAIERFMEIITKVKPFEGSYGFLISNNGSFVAHPSTNNVGKLFSEIYPRVTHQNNVLYKVANGEAFNFEAISNETKQLCYFSFAPIYIGGAKTPWSFAVVVPINIIVKEANATFIRTLLIGLFGLILIAIIIWLMANNMANPIIRTTKAIKTISRGEIDHVEQLPAKSKDEIGQMEKALNNLVNGLTETAKFAEQIGKGNLEVTFSPLSDNDILGTSLLEMRDSLAIAKHEEEKRREEEEKRNWATNGLAFFADILRKNNDDLRELSHNIISGIIKYLNINQGGLFLLNDDNSTNPYLELYACFAYDRRKFLEKKIEIGEGLIGGCYIEQKTLYLRHLPQNYIYITSGLGEIPPTSLLIVPLKFNETAYGVIELASLIEFEPYQIQFVEKIAENIAATISSVKINLKTAQLLRQSQAQAEQMRSQEEEMRQNLEELHATQEEMARKSAETDGIMNGINSTLAIIEFSSEAEILNINKIALHLLNKDSNEIIGCKHKDILPANYIENGRYQKLWNALLEGYAQTEIIQYITPIGTVWTKETFTPILNLSGIVVKVMSFMVDVTEQKVLEERIQSQLHQAQELEHEMRHTIDELHTMQEEIAYKEMERKGILEALNFSTNMVEYDLDGKITFVNNAYLSLLNMNANDVIGTHHNYKMQFSENQLREYQQFWEDLRNGIHKKEINKVDLGNKVIWLLETYTPIKNKESKVFKVLKIAIDITESKKIEQELYQQTEEIKAQREELRQNMEEFASIQDDYHSKTKQLERLQEELKMKTTKLEAASSKIEELQDQYKIKEKNLREEIERLRKLAKK